MIPNRVIDISYLVAELVLYEERHAHSKLYSTVSVEFVHCLYPS